VWWKRKEKIKNKKRSRTEVEKKRTAKLSGARVSGKCSQTRRAIPGACVRVIAMPVKKLC
jgi:hypothetical protein